MKAADAMTAAPITVRPETMLIQAVQLMLEHGVSGLPVVDSAGRLAGIITEGDLLHRHEIGTERHNPRWIEVFRTPRLVGEYVRAHGSKVGDVMTADVVAVDDEASLAEVVELMEKRQINRVPVVREGVLVGIISRADLIRTFVRAAHEETPKSTDDSAIREWLNSELSNQPWTVPNTVHITVHDGVVELGGTVSDERYRSGLRVAAENTPGVRAVQDHLLTTRGDEPGYLLGEGAKYIPATEGAGRRLE